MTSRDDGAARPALEPAPDESDAPSTLPGSLAWWARTHPEQVAMREKRLGLWQEITWRAYLASVRATARMLWELGVRPGDHVAILSDNRPEWLYADLGAQAIGARSVGIYQTNPPDDVAYILEDAGCTVLFCEDQEQVDKVVAIGEKAPRLAHVIVIEPRGTRDVDDPRLLAWETFIADGRARIASGEGDGDGEDGDGGDAWFAERLAALDPTAPAMVVYTSGTTGPPKGAMLSSRNVLTIAREFNQQVGMCERDTVLSYLPLCHVAEKIFSLFLPLTAGAVVHFGESIDTVQTDLREVSPTVFLGVPRIWEKMNATVRVKMQDASWLKRALYGSFSRRGAEIAARRIAGRVTAWDRIVWWVGDLVLYRPLQERLGLRRCRLPISGAAPISPDLLAWFHGVGIRVLEGFGQTESAGVSHLNPLEAIRLGTVGVPIPLVDCAIADDGEILLRGPNVFCGYLGRPDATADTVDADGWLHTGDIGEIDADGYLRITGRKKQIIITSGGKNLSPEKIENALKTSPYVKEAVAVGDDRKFVSALIQIEYDTVGDWATRRQLPFTSFADLAGKPAVVALVAGEVEPANELLARVEQVRAFRLIDKELSQDDGELTATQKVKRRAVHAAFADTIEQMYGSRT